MTSPSPSVVETVGAAIGAELIRQELAGEDFDEAESNAALARAAIAAMREPSGEQIDAALRNDHRWSINAIPRIKAAYTAMIDAALSDTPATRQGGEDA